MLTRFANGSLGTFESTRYARGHKAAYTLEINGEKGSLAWDLHDYLMTRLSPREREYVERARMTAWTRESTVQNSRDARLGLPSQEVRAQWVAALRLAS